MLKSNCKIMQNDKNGRIEEMVKMEEMVEREIVTTATGP